MKKVMEKITKSKSIRGALALGILHSTLGCSLQNQKEETPAMESSTLELFEGGQIIGGVAVGAREYMASTTVQVFNLRESTSCTGSLVARNLVLTAGHCTARNASDLRIVFSIRVPKSMEDMRNMVVRKVVAGRAAEGWARLSRNQEFNWGDIALLRFDGTLPVGYQVASLSSQSGLLRDGATVTLAGFGQIDGRRSPASELRKVDVTVAKAKLSATEFLLDQRQGRGACHGDSGGPAFAQLGTRNVVVGVTSRGFRDPLDQCNQFAVYTSVSAYGAWLQATARELNANSNLPTMIPQPTGL